MTRNFATIDHALSSIYAELYRDGKKSSPRGQDTVEIEDYHFVITDPLQGVTTNIDRKLNYSLVALEFLSYVSGVGGTREHADLTKSIASNFASFVDETTGVLNGAYGPRLELQLQQVIDVLRADPDSRQAQAIIARPLESTRVLTPGHPGEEKDYPCTRSFGFRIRNGKLNMSVVMRSNDLYWGTPYDVAAFTLVQRLVASLLGVPVGTYSHYAESMHYYTRVQSSLANAYGHGVHKSNTLVPLQLDYPTLDLATSRFKNMIADRTSTVQFDQCSDKVRRENLKKYDDEYSTGPDRGLWLMLTKRAVLGRK